MIVSGRRASREGSQRSFSGWRWLALGLTVACGTEPVTVARQPPPSADAGAHALGPPEEPCAACHPNHVAEWRISPHAYAMRDPVFHAMVRLGQAETEGRMDQFCTGCHTPIGARDGKTEVYFDDTTGTYQQRTEGLDPVTMAGVSCEVCHSITKVNDEFNAGFEMTRDGVRRATISMPMQSPAHESAFSPLHSDSDVCGTCHQVINDFNVPLERTMGEWVQSPFPGQKSCQDCHMPEYSGVAAAGGPTRNVHRHDFVGVDVSLLSPEEFPGYDEMRELSRALLQESAQLTLAVPTAERALEVQIENLAGHALPSGATADREMWIEVLVFNAAGEPVFESGTLDEEGNLRIDDAERTVRPGTDPQLVLYSQKMYFDPSLADPSATEPRRRVDFLWQPNAEESHLVVAGGRDTSRYDFTSLGAGAYTATVRLLFRSFSPHLLRKLEAEAGLDPAVLGRVPTVEMETASISFDLP